MMNVLIVDDNFSDQMALKTLVAGMDNCFPLIFSVPGEALAWCEQNEPDLILLNYMMPEIDGIAFLRRFRAMSGKKLVPVIILAADGCDTEVRHRALEAGANDFLNKPIVKIEFLARMNSILESRCNQKQLTNCVGWLVRETKKTQAVLAAHEHETIFLLAKAAEYRDPETGAHILRMAHYSCLIGARLGLPESELNILLDAAPMHDVGKVGIPDRILLKSGKLDEDEFVAMKQHTQIGWDILQGRSANNRLLEMAAEIALTHHERFDGTGYPNGLRGDAIPLLGRIAAVADVFDALVSSRPYKQAWEIGSAAEYIRENAGKHFDPDCVEAFFAEWDSVMAIRNLYYQGGTRGDSAAIHAEVRRLQS